MKSSKMFLNLEKDILIGWERIVNDKLVGLITEGIRFIFSLALFLMFYWLRFLMDNIYPRTVYLIKKIY